MHALYVLAHKFKLSKYKAYSKQYIPGQHYLEDILTVTLQIIMFLEQVHFAKMVDSWDTRFLMLLIS